jgi:hypothetical protein
VANTYSCNQVLYQHVRLQALEEASQAPWRTITHIKGHAAKSMRGTTTLAVRIQSILLSHDAGTIPA